MNREIDLSLIRIPPERITPLPSVVQSDLSWTLWPYVSGDYFLAFQIPEKIEQALLLQLPIHSREHVTFVKTLPHRETSPLDATVLSGDELTIRTLYIGLLDFRDRLWVELRYIESKHRALQGDEPIKSAFRRIRYIATLMDKTYEATKYVEESFPQFAEALKTAFADRLNAYRPDHALRMIHPFLKPFVLKMPNYKTYDFIDLSTERPKMMCFDSEHQYDFSAIRQRMPGDPDPPPRPNDGIQWPPMPTQRTFLTNLTLEDYWMPFLLTDWQIKTIQPQLPMWSSMHMRFTRTIPHKEFVPLQPNISGMDLRNLYINTYCFRDAIWAETKIIHALANLTNSSIPFWKGQEMLWYAHYIIQRACQGLVYMEELAEAIDARNAAAAAAGPPPIVPPDPGRPTPQTISTAQGAWSEAKQPEIAAPVGKPVDGQGNLVSSEEINAPDKRSEKPMDAALTTGDDQGRSNDKKDKPVGNEASSTEDTKLQTAATSEPAAGQGDSLSSETVSGSAEGGEKLSNAVSSTEDDQKSKPNNDTSTEELTVPPTDAPTSQKRTRSMANQSESQGGEKPTPTSTTGNGSSQQTNQPTGGGTASAFVPPTAPPAGTPLQGVPGAPPAWIPPVIPPAGTPLQGHQPPQQQQANQPSNAFMSQPQRQELAGLLRSLLATRTQRYGPNHPLRLLQGLLVTTVVSMPDYNKQVTWGRRDELGRWMYPMNGEPELGDYFIDGPQPEAGQASGL